MAVSDIYCLHVDILISYPQILGGRHHFDREAGKMVKEFGTHGYIANLGHGMLPTMKPDALGIFVDEVHKCSESMGKGKKRKKNGS